MKYFQLLMAALCFLFSITSWYFPIYAGAAFAVILSAIGSIIVYDLWLQIPED